MLKAAGELILSWFWVFPGNMDGSFPSASLGNANFRRSSAPPPYRLNTGDRGPFRGVSWQSLETESGLFTFLAIPAGGPKVSIGSRRLQPAHFFESYPV